MIMNKRSGDKCSINTFLLLLLLLLLLTVYKTINKYISYLNCRHTETDRGRCCCLRFFIIILNFIRMLNRRESEKERKRSGMSDGRVPPHRPTACKCTHMHTQLPLSSQTLERWWPTNNRSPSNNDFFFIYINITVVLLLTFYLEVVVVILDFFLFHSSKNLGEIIFARYRTFVLISFCAWSKSCFFSSSFLIFQLIRN